MLAPQTRRARGYTLLELLVVVAIIAVLVGLLLPAVQKAREAANRAKCQNQMKQLGLAFHNFENTFGHFPQGWVNAAPQPRRYGRSFVPELLPFLEQAALHRRYDFHQSWNAADNRPVVGTDVAGLACPSAPPRPDKAVNDYPVSDPIGADARRGLGIPATAPLSAYAGFFAQAMTQGQTAAATRAADVCDGLSNTFLLFEDAGRPDLWVRGQRTPPGGMYSAGNEKWADPANRITVQVWCGTPINCNNGNEIYSFHPGGANFVMGDGAVKFLAENLAPATFVALYTRAGGEVVGTSW